MVHLLMRLTLFILQVIDIRTFRPLRRVPELDRDRNAGFEVYDSRDYSLITSVNAWAVSDLKPRGC